jgi:predicted AlkP superfamily pyrophosphatase or phosphodiesterase
MLNQESIAAVASARLTEDFGKPLYDSYSFAQIPATVMRLLTGQGAGGLPAAALGTLPTRYDKVILCLVDAFGWRFFERYAERYPLLRRFLEEGVVSKLTTQFPSTTSAHTTTIHTGLSVGQSGIYEWFIYDPNVDRIIAPLLFSYAGDRERNTLRKSGFPPEAFFPNHSLYSRLQAAGVVATITQSREFTPSPIAEVICKGAQLMPFRTMAEGMATLVEVVRRSPGPTYHYFYYDGLDAICHHYGPNSPQFDAEVDSFFTALERLVYAALAGKVGHTLLLLTADHGQIEVSAQRLLNLKQIVPGLEALIRINRYGEKLIATGSPRDMFLHIRDEALDEAEAMLRQALAGRVEVHRTSALIDQGMFGPVSEAFLARVGNMVLLPRRHDQIWWFDSMLPTAAFLGHHGGLSAAEMETLLLALPL